jgi:hypothetical protein
MLTKPQAIFIFNQEKFQCMKGGSSRGLIKKGLIHYRWGCDPSYGYIITNEARKAFNEYNQNEKNSKPFKDYLKNKSI